MRKIQWKEDAAPATSNGVAEYIPDGCPGKQVIGFGLEGEMAPDERQWGNRYKAGKWH